MRTGIHAKTAPTKALTNCSLQWRSKPGAMQWHRKRENACSHSRPYRTKTDRGTAGRKVGPIPFNVVPQKYHRIPQRLARSVGLFLGVWIAARCPVVRPVDVWGADIPEFQDGCSGLK